VKRAWRSACVSVLAVLAVAPTASHAVGWNTYVYIDFVDRAGRFGSTQHLGTNWSHPEYTENQYDSTCVAAWDVASSSWAGEVRCIGGGATKEYDRRFVRVPWAGGGEGYGSSNAVVMSAYAFNWD